MGVLLRATTGCCSAARMHCLCSMPENGEGRDRESPWWVLARDENDPVHEHMGSGGQTREQERGRVGVAGSTDGVSSGRAGR